jgi:hypothetical protein
VRYNFPEQQTEETTKCSLPEQQAGETMYAANHPRGAAGAAAGTAGVEQHGRSIMARRQKGGQAESDCSCRARIMSSSALLSSSTHLSVVTFFFQAFLHFFYQHLFVCGHLCLLSLSCVRVSQLLAWKRRRRFGWCVALYFRQYHKGVGMWAIPLISVEYFGTFMALPFCKNCQKIRQCVLGMFTSENIDTMEKKIGSLFFLEL